MNRGVLLKVLAACIVVAVFLVLILLPIPWCPKSPVPFSITSMGMYGVKKLMRMNGFTCIDVDICQENLLIFDDVMREMDIPFILSEGTALGVRREGRIMPHDDDVDTSVSFVHLERFLSQALPMLGARGFTVNLVWNQGKFFSMSRRGESLDVDFVQPGQRCMSFTRGKVDLMQICGTEDVVRFTQGASVMKFLGRDFRVFGEDYLEWRHGEDWRTSDKHPRCELT